MNKEKLEAYMKNLKTPYTGMTEELSNKIEGIEVKHTDKIDLDLNQDGKVDKQDFSKAGRVLAEAKNKQKVK